MVSPLVSAILTSPSLLSGLCSPGAQTQLCNPRAWSTDISLPTQLPPSKCTSYLCGVRSGFAPSPSTWCWSSPSVPGTQASPLARVSSPRFLTSLNPKTQLQVLSSPFRYKPAPLQAPSPAPEDPAQPCSPSRPRLQLTLQVVNSMGGKRIPSRGNSLACQVPYITEVGGFSQSWHTLSHVFILRLSAS